MLAILKKVDTVSLGSPPKFKVKVKIQRFSTLSFRFIKYQGGTEKFLTDNWKFIKTKINTRIFIMKFPCDIFYLSQACFPDNHIFHRIHICTHQIHKKQIEHLKLPIWKWYEKIFAVEKFTSLVALLLSYMITERPQAPALKDFLC